MAMRQFLSLGYHIQTSCDDHQPPIQWVPGTHFGGKAARAWI